MKARLNSCVARYNLCYRIRKKGYVIITRERIIIAECGSEPMKVHLINRLVKEYDFYIQFRFNNMENKKSNSNPALLSVGECINAATELLHQCEEKKIKTIELLRIELFFRAIIRFLKQLEQTEEHGKD